jgi:ABC-type spermidine/putrescine transport system permease subunit I
MKQITLYTASTHFPFLVSNLVRAMMEKQLLTSGKFLNNVLKAEKYFFPF